MPGRSTQSVNRKSDRLPPHSEEAEKSILGSILLDHERVIDLCTTKGVVPDSFYIPRHRSLYEVYELMSRDNRSIDLVTVGERLKALKRLDAVGGYDYLEELVDSTPTAIHAEHYADIVYQNHLLRRIINRSREAIETCYQGEEDATSVLNKVEQSILEISQTERSDQINWDVLIKDAMREIEENFQTKAGFAGIPSGYVDLDNKLQGFKNGEMIILAARPSQGKTSLALNIAENISTVHREDAEARPVAVFSLEMSSDQLAKRMICSHARVSSHKLLGGYINKVQHKHLVQAADALMKAPLYLDDTAGLEALELRSRARRLKRNFDIQMIIIDYLQMMNYSTYAREGRQRETAAISNAMKSMAKELKVPVLVLSQLSRAPETRDKLGIPKLSDLRDSGSIEQDADVVMMLRRPCKYPDDENSKDDTLAILNVAKNRNGPVGQVKLNFFEDFTRFDNRSEGVDEDRPYEYE